MTDLTKLTLKAAIDGLKARDFSSEEITKAFVANIDASNPTLNAYVIQTTDKALEMARVLPARLHPVPGTAKHNVLAEVMQQGGLTALLDELLGCPPPP